LETLISRFLAKDRKRNSLISRRWHSKGLVLFFHTPFDQNKNCGKFNDQPWGIIREWGLIYQIRVPGCGIN